MKCFLCNKEIKDNQSRTTLWVDHQEIPVKTVHRKCRDKKNLTETLPYGYGHYPGMKNYRI